MPVTAKDVAERAGVALGTVSKVLNGHVSARRKPTKLQVHIRQVAEELGYHPNLIARSLARQRTDTIGLMLSLLDNPFFVEVLREFEAAVFTADYQVLLDANSLDYGEYQPLHRISGWMADGVLIWTTPEHSLSDYLGHLAAKMPVVYLGHLRDDGSDACAFDLYDAGRQAIEHLMSRGYRRPCFLSAQPRENVLKTSHKRDHQMQAVVAACDEAGLELETVVIDDFRKITSLAFPAARSIAERPRSERPDALICYNDQMALSAYNGLLAGGLRIPDDIALISFDGIEQVRYLPYGPLTTVRMPVDALCRTALDILLRRIAGDDETPPQQILIPTELIIGATT